MSKKKKKQRPAPESLGLPCNGVETHAHLDMEPLAQDLDQVLERAAKAGVREIGNVFLGPEAYERDKGLFQGRDQVFFLLGVHPHEAKDCGEDQLQAMARAFAGDDRLKAWGEIGLDYFYDRSPRETQQKVLQDQLALAKEADLPVVIHCRDALEDMLAILEDMGMAHRPLLWHCFGGDRDLVERVVARGWHISIPGTVTFSKNTVLREAVPSIPQDRLVLETDCPFMAPEPYRGKTNEPSLLPFTAQVVAGCRDQDPAELWAECGVTARKFFGL